MLWLNKIVDELEKRHPKGEIVTESGIAPSGSYHMGYLREIITTDAVVRELQRRGRQARHIHFVDDMDGFRKVPSYLPPEYEQYLGKSLCDIPAPDGSKKSYADVAFESFANSVDALGIKIDVMRSHEKYRSGFFVEAIEKTLDDIDVVRKVLEDVSGRKLGEEWSPIQVNEDGYLKKRPYKRIDKKSKTITYLDKDDREQTISYAKGDVKLDWRLDWPARWWLLGIEAEPFGRDHATKGGSYDTGAALVKDLYNIQPPVPIPYDFVNRAGDTKKMSASKGNGILMSEVVTVLPPEVARYFILQAPPSKLLFFDPEGGVVRLIDEFAALLAKPDKNDSDKQLIAACTDGIDEITVSNVPFSLLVASYQAALKDPNNTLNTMRRSEYKKTVDEQEETIKKELRFIDEWLERWAPEDVKFALADKVDKKKFNKAQQEYMSQLADKVEKAPKDADGEWFHKAIYEFKDKIDLPTKELFSTLYEAIINKQAGPRAGWFLSLLPRDWLIKRLRLEA